MGLHKLTNTAIHWLLHGTQDKEISKKFPIIEAMQSGNVAKFKKLLDSQTHVNHRFGEEKNTLLHFAVKFGNKEYIQLLTDRNADASLQNTAGQTPLHLAVLQVARPDVLNTLLRSPSLSFDQVDVHGNTPLHNAIGASNVDFVKFFLDKAENDDSLKSILGKKNENGFTPLGKAKEWLEIDDKNESAKEIVRLLKDNVQPKEHDVAEDKIMASVVEADAVLQPGRKI